MSECCVSKDRMIEALYGELGRTEKERLDAHLRSCPDCAAEYASLEETLRIMDKRERPEPGPAFWDGYWDRLSKRMLWESIENGRRPSPAARLAQAFSRLPRWSLQAAAAAALLLVGVFVGGRLIPRPGAPGATAASAAIAAPPAAVVQADNFIDRSKVLLLGLVNFDPAVEDAYALDLDKTKAVSRELVTAAPDIRRGLDQPGQRRLRDLVAELEVIMLQIANLESGQDLEGVELVKQGVDSRGLFLRIDLDRMSRASGGATPAVPAGVGSSKKSRV